MESLSNHISYHVQVEYLNYIPIFYLFQNKKQLKIT
jgi:hypothetical protein